MDLNQSYIIMLKLEKYLPRLVGIVRGNPGVSQGYPTPPFKYPYPRAGYGYLKGRVTGKDINPYLARGYGFLSYRETG
jgi:hypothetical protein